jgi:dTDP-4-amino-4,6-dideoxygalactose transaminase
VFRAIPRHNVNLTSTELQLVLAAALGRGEHCGGRVRFEEDCRQYFGTSHAIAVESGRTSLHLALHGLDLAPGSVVVLPRYCFFSLVHVVQGMGLVPRFAPVDPLTYGMDPRQLESHIHDAAAVVFIHPFGQIADVIGLQTICASRGIPLVEDASQATGAKWGVHRAGAIGDVGVFSLVSGKNLQTFGGGLVTTSRDDVAQRIQERMKTSKSRDDKHIQTAFQSGLQRWFLTTPIGFKSLMHPLTLGLQTIAPAKLDAMFHEEHLPYDPDRELFFLSDTQGALGSLELEELDRRNIIRRNHALRMLDGLRGLHQLGLPHFDKTAENSFNAVAVKTTKARCLAHSLRQRGFDTRTDYMEWYGTETDFDEDVIYLPNHPGMATKDIDRLVATIRSHFAQR